MRSHFLALSVLLLIGRADANSLERWYTYWGLGYADVGYPTELDGQLDALASLPGVDHMSISLDMLGFYCPSGESRLYGLILNTFGDRYEQGDVSMQLNGYLLAASTMLYTERIGQGPFLRLEAGPAKYVVQTSIGGYDDDQSSDWGIGALFGGGYAFPIADGTRILLNANYALRRIEGETTTTLGLSIGGLF